MDNRVTQRIVPGKASFDSKRHGTFTANTDHLGKLAKFYFENAPLVGGPDVRRGVAAEISETAEGNYFDCDEMTLLAIASEFGWTTDNLIHAMRKDAWEVARVWRYYVG